MKISVIIPCYEPGAFLLEAIASVVAQSYVAHEIIVVNDGSSATAVFEEAKARFPGLIFIHVPDNRGVAHARNAGIAHASGEIMAFLDQDDQWTPDKLQLQAGYLAAHPECDYVTSRQRYFLSEGVGNVPGWVKPEHMDTDLSGFLPGTLTARRRAFAAIGTFNENLTAGTDDVDWFFRAQAAGLKTHQLPETLLLKRIHHGNLSKSALAHNKELLSVVRSNMARRKKISVIIPCYNGKKFIAESIESAQAQDGMVGEIIVVDDASTDGSADYVTEHFPQVKLIRLAANKGIGGARNAGLHAAQYPLIGFLDADDLWPQGRCQHLWQAMERSSAPWAFGAIEHFGAGDKYALPPTQTGYFASAMLVQADFMQKVGGFNEQLRVGEFIDWFDRARAFHAAPEVIADVVLKRRIHGENSSIVAGNANAQDYLKVVRAAIERKRQRAEG